MLRCVPSCLISGVLFVASAHSQTSQSVEPNALGWRWACAPLALDNLPSARAIGEITFAIARLADGSLFATVSHAGAMELAGLRTDYRLVAFDDAAARHELPQRSSAGSQAMTVMSFTIPASMRATRVGVEVLRPEGRRLVSQDAVRKANEQGIEVLPLPEVGKPLAFELTDIKGRPIRSEELLGKLVLIDFWATWCGPCMAKMPKLKQIYEEWHTKGLEVVGVSYDKSAEDCLETASKQMLPWQLVHVPEKDPVRALWEAASGVNALPRLFLIDREGIVREDFYPLDLEATLRPYLMK